MNLIKFFNRGNVKGDISPTEFINRGNVKNKLPKGQHRMRGSSNIDIPELGDWSDTLSEWGSRELTPYQAVTLNNFLIHSGYSGYDTIEALNKFGLTDVVSKAIKEGSDFTPYLRDALKKDPVALAAFDGSLKQAASYDDIFKTVNASKAELAKIKAREEQAAALYKINKQIEQANKNAEFMEKYGVQYNKFNASKEYMKDVLWRGDKSIYNSIKNIKNMNKQAKFIGWNGLNMFSPYLWNSSILEEVFGNRPLKDWGQATQMATTGFAGSKLFGGASNKTAAIAAALQFLASLGSSSYFRQNQSKPNNTESQEKLIEKLIENKLNKLNEPNNTENQEKPIKKSKGW